MANSSSRVRDDDTVAVVVVAVVVFDAEDVTFDNVVSFSVSFLLLAPRDA